LQSCLICGTLYGMETIKIVFYRTESKKEPFNEWLDDLDKKAQSIVLDRITRVTCGNFGDCKPLKGHKGIYELVINYGPGYRVYYGKDGSVIVILLLGGEKKSQERDIEKAYRYWNHYKEEKS
jgi:putative addiction module killer protein